MNLIQLKYIIEVAKTGSISRAAANLSMNQPHLSKSLRELEDSLGVTLFYRSSRGVIPTEQGTKVLGYAKKILGQVEEIKKVCRDGTETKTLLNIAAPAAGYVSATLGEFVAKSDPAIPVSARCLRADAAEAVELASGDAGFLGIVRISGERRDYYQNVFSSYNLIAEPLWEFQRRVLVSASFPISGETLSTAVLSDCTEIVCGDFGEGEVSNNKIAVNERAAALELLSACPDSYMQSAPEPAPILRRYGLVQKKLAESGETYGDVLVYRADRALGNGERRFIGILKSKIFELETLNK